MYELFYYPDNASLAPHFVLEEIGAPFTLTLVDRTRNAQKSPQYLERNPLGRIPTLAYGNVVLFESAAICLHLADRHPEARLAPAVASDARAHLYKWLMFLTNTIQPDHMAFFYADRYTADPRGAVAVSAAAEERLGQAYAAVDAALQREGPFLLGRDVSVADFYLLMLIRWGAKQRNHPKHLPGIRRCAELLLQRASVQRAAITEQLQPIY
ncbi:MAG TPA: glutathione S-transferase family protein [Pseudomonadales bacterium]|nr:glutathione S-transferase family protein [Pseudomonadales bacterium]